FVLRVVPHHDPPGAGEQGLGAEIGHAIAAQGAAPEARARSAPAPASCT
ncbi:MAG: hypothetical protein JWN00_5450, partial [Actinomycetia bacterium]|nr:hypothetical protein [Actinomycetes bacterium]